MLGHSDKQKDLLNLNYFLKFSYILGVNINCDFIANLVEPVFEPFDFFEDVMDESLEVLKEYVFSIVYDVYELFYVDDETIGYFFLSEEIEKCVMSADSTESLTNECMKYLPKNEFLSVSCRKGGIVIEHNISWSNLCDLELSVAILGMFVKVLEG